MSEEISLELAIYCLQQIRESERIMEMNQGLVEPWRCSIQKAPSGSFLDFIIKFRFEENFSHKIH